MKCNHCGHDFYGHTPTADPDVMNCPGCYGGKCSRRKVHDRVASWSLALKFGSPFRIFLSTK